ncbi:MAG: choloylglycine hydrolase, partial [Bacteroidia bacterium]
RDFRMNQLLKQINQFLPEDAAKVLRDQNGLNDKAIGFTNEKGINQLIAHHSVIFKPEDGLVWVSTAPYQLGKYVCYDLNKVFAEAPAISENKEIQDLRKTIAADTFLTSKGYQDFLLFKKLKYYIQFCTKSAYELKIDEKYLTAFVSSNENCYYTYWVIGDYYTKIKNKELAVSYYKKALTKEVATQKEASQIIGLINELTKTVN